MTEVGKAKTRLEFPPSHLATRESQDMLQVFREGKDRAGVSSSSNIATRDGQDMAGVSREGEYLG